MVPSAQGDDVTTVGGGRDTLLEEQARYYAERAEEYDDWFHRRGRYDRGEEHNARWRAEAETVVRAIVNFAPAGRVLELASGTGLWTQHLARSADSVTAVDASAEMHEVSRRRSFGAPLEYEVADLFAWRPARRYDVVFFGFWLSHVPPDRFEEFWAMVGDCLAPGGRVLLVDSLYNGTSPARDEHLEGEEAITMTRALSDGRRFRIYKVYYRPEQLEAAVAPLGWRLEARGTANHFLYAWGQRCRR
jgi:SAM-dependent methyltransferase